MTRKTQADLRMDAIYLRAAKFNAMAAELASARTTVVDALAILEKCPHRCSRAEEAAAVLRAMLPPVDRPVSPPTSRRLHSV